MVCRDLTIRSTSRSVVAYGQRLAEPPGDEAQAILRDQGFNFGSRRSAADPQCVKDYGPEQQENVGGIEGRRVDAHHNFSVPGFDNRHLNKPELQSASLFHEGTHSRLTKSVTLNLSHPAIEQLA